LNRKSFPVDSARVLFGGVGSVFGTTL